ncbi:peptidoglycan-binding domain-containing protein [Hirschia litorea]|uniref:Peptidoglycan-binding protein n=1 Tax=Hirschia litorea TaxID=1199156 RepID=A0ABW2IN18_9PROT
MNKKLLAAVAVVVGFAGNANAGGFSSYNPMGDLPDAQAGQCFARIAIPAQYEKVPETVVVEEAYERLSARAPEFGPSTVDVKVKDEGVRYVVRQPVYETQTEQVMVKPGHERLAITPAKFETVTETVVISEARKVWKAGSNLSSHRKIDEKTGQVYCLVEIPAKTRTITRRVLVQPEQVSRVPVNAEYVTVQKQVLVDRGGVEEVPTPAEFKTIPTQELLTPARTESTMSQARMDTVERNVLRAPERFEWVEVLCDTNANSSSISDLQRALKDRGYYMGPIDGVIGPQTENAVRKFQSANGLPHQGFVTMETLRMLGLSGGMVQQSYSQSYQSEPAYTAPVQSHETQTYSEPSYTAPAHSAPEQRYYKPEIMPHSAPIEDGSAIRRDGSQTSVQGSHFKEAHSRSQSMAAEFDAKASAMTGRQAANQLLAQGGQSYTSVQGVMTEADLQNVQHEVANVGTSIQQATPLTTQTRFQRPAQYSVRNRLNWDDK